MRFGEVKLEGHVTRSLAYEFKVQGANLDVDEVYTLEVTMGYLETDVLQIQRDVIEKAFNPMNKELPLGSDSERLEQEFINVLVQHNFVIDEIEDDADMLLTLIAVCMSFAIIYATVYFCYYGLLKPQCLKLKTKLTKSD